ncbi:MAG: hypothetical protein K1Y36_30270 [Blastocatellia bacterium]|nr:hypothetical protein [Blastocatellia bacterium]
MGWRGIIRTIGAANRRAERDSRRRYNEFKRWEKDFHKMQELQRATAEVDQFNTYLEFMKSFHTDCGSLWDWEEIKFRNPPVEAPRQNFRVLEGQALLHLNNFRPSFFDKILGSAQKKRDALAQKVEEAKRADEQKFLESKRFYQQAVNEWNQLQSLADAILAGDLEAYLEVCEEVAPLKEVQEIGSSIELTAHNREVMEVVLCVNSETVIPKETKSLLKTGKLSVKKMGQTQFYDIYQDYVCSGVLRVGREIFALLPVEWVLVTAVGEILNSSTGLVEVQPLLSVAFPRRTFSQINFSLVDPSDCLKNFLHRMNFKKTSGFVPIQKLNLSDIP